MNMFHQIYICNYIMHFNGRGLRHKTYQACSKEEYVKHWYRQVLTGVCIELDLNLQVNCCGVAKTVFIFLRPRSHRLRSTQTYLLKLALNVMSVVKINLCKVVF